MYFLTIPAVPTRRIAWQGRLEADRETIIRFLDHLQFMGEDGIPLPVAECSAIYGHSLPAQVREQQSSPGTLELLVFWERYDGIDYWRRLGVLWESHGGHREFYGGHVALAPGRRRDGSDTVVVVLSEHLLLRDYWQYVAAALRSRFANLGKGGRPLGSGVFAGREDFLQVVGKAVVALRKKGERPTRERVAEYLAGSADSSLPVCDERQLSRWRKDYGFASWEALIEHFR